MLQIAAIAAFLTFSAAASAEQLCYKGATKQRINLDNGAEITTFTGVVRCVDKKTNELKREISYKKGKQHGPEKLLGFDKKWVETDYKEGKRHGWRKLWNVDHKFLERETLYVDDKEVGDERTYFTNGKLERKIEHVVAGGDVVVTSDYNEDGTLKSMSCHGQPLGQGTCKYGTFTGAIKMFFEGQPRTIRLKNGLLDISDEVRKPPQ